MPLNALVTALEIELRLAIPTRQTPIAERCPPYLHAHAGFAECHPIQRKHRVASQQLHESHQATEGLKQQRDSQWANMRTRAKAGKPVSDAMRANFSRIQQYLDLLHGHDRA